SPLRKPFRRATMPAPVAPPATRVPRRRRGAAFAITLGLALLGAWLLALPAQAGEGAGRDAAAPDGAGVELASVAVRSGGGADAAAFDGTVQAVRQTV